MPARRSLIPCGTIALLCVAGCQAAPSLDSLPVHEYRGHYTSASHASWFRPCGTSAVDSAMWVTFTGESVAQMDSLRQSGHFRDGESSYGDLLAAVTTDGVVGPRGPGAPALLVHRIIALRPAADSDCADAR